MPDEKKSFGFPSTVWTRIRHAQELDTSAQEDLLIRVLAEYCGPILAYFKVCVKHAQQNEDAQDLLQAFLLSFISQPDKLKSLDQSRGRFRDWLRTCMRNFYREHVRRGNAQKRKPERLVSIDHLANSSGFDFEVADSSSPENAYKSIWKRTIVDAAMQKLELECQQLSRTSGIDRVVCLRIFQERLERNDWASIAQSFGVTKGQAKTKAEWVKRKLREKIREQIATYAADEYEIDEEIRDLLSE